MFVDFVSFVGGGADNCISFFGLKADWFLSGLNFSKNQIRHPSLVCSRTFRQDVAEGFDGTGLKEIGCD